VIIRRETPADVPAVQAVTEAAFGRPFEADLLARLRAGEGWLPPLSLVATTPGAEGEVIGHVVCSRGHAGSRPALGLGPISVRPDRQGRGVGLALMHAALGAADALGEPLVALLGSPDFYGRFGFRTSTDHGIDPSDPEWGAFFQVRTLAAHDPADPGLRGTFRYATAFDEPEPDRPDRPDMS
jgi:putative acetyltransferase